MRTICLLTTVALFGCGFGSDTGTWQARRETVGDTTIVHTLSGQVWPDSVELVEEVRIGMVEGPEEQMFGEVTRLAEDREGGIYVMDDQGPIIRHYDRAGKFIGNIGGAGEGPAEYKNLSMGMVVDSAGTLHVNDWGNRRFVRFARDGSALDPWPLESSFITTLTGTWVYSYGRDRVLVLARVDEKPALLRIDGGRVVDTLRVPELPGMPAKRGGPYRINTHWGWHDDGYFVVGVSDKYAIEVRKPTGVLRITRDVPAQPVHPEEAAEWRRYFEWMADKPMYRAPEGEWIPAHMPPFRAIDVARDGRIWVRRNTQPIPVEVEPNPDGPPPVAWAQPFLYDVFEADGTYLGEIRFPDRVEPLLFGSGHVWAVRRGDFDEHYVVRLVLRGVD